MTDKTLIDDMNDNGLDDIVKVVDSFCARALVGAEIFCLIREKGIRYLVANDTLIIDAPCSEVASLLSPDLVESEVRPELSRLAKEYICKLRDDLIAGDGPNVVFPLYSAVFELLEDESWDES